MNKNHHVYKESSTTKKIINVIVMCPLIASLPQSRCPPCRTPSRGNRAPLGMAEPNLDSVKKTIATAETKSKRKEGSEPLKKLLD
jgi:hypothetical protein